jgi:hypothetical protein
VTSNVRKEDDSDIHKFGYSSRINKEHPYNYGDTMRFIGSLLTEVYFSEANPVDRCCIDLTLELAYILRFSSRLPRSTCPRSGSVATGRFTFCNMNNLEKMGAKVIAVSKDNWINTVDSRL